MKSKRTRIKRIRKKFIGKAKLAVMRKRNLVRRMQAKVEKIPAPAPYYCKFCDRSWILQRSCPICDERAKKWGWGKSPGDDWVSVGEGSFKRKKLIHT